ncbi:agglutinin Isolectin 1 [Colletotrichum truncatum]|uniref:Agglutinin Isolectin 1 n=1 Tax=Colletotrichum truncatum TaxID=5467 RepID=A0ACC3Z2T2_COLTU|nr:agglutinin Isolectin 1 [Colletotrichum truncatum]KAF6793305.1 agglutinin Isolectin 1 [Colletotrichum truncatum]
MVKVHFLGLSFLIGIAAAAVSTDNSCGGTKALTCPGSLCCSQYNWCGVSDAHCGAGCQTKFGRCTTTPAGSGKITPDGTCGGINKYTCTGGTFGNCCSKWGYCGSTDGHCLNDCQSSFGDCSSITVGGKDVSQDGACGGTNGRTCQGSTFGDCCSKWGYCGSSNDHCGTDCQTSFGKCNGSGGGGTAATSAAPNPPSTSGKASPDGSCGGTNGYKCPTGQCCSRRGWCGTTSDFCGFGCQSAFSAATCTACPGEKCAGTITGNPICSANNNYCWTLSSKKFQITCGRLATGDYIGYADVKNFGECISKCAANSACVAASFYQGASTTCSLLSSYQGPADGNSAGGSQNHAYVRGPTCG